VDGFYRDDDLDEDESERMVVSALARLAAAVRRYECPVLVSKARDDEFSEPVDRLVDERIECLETDEGARFIGAEFESLVYPVGNRMLQTTLTFGSRSSRRVSRHIRRRSPRARSRRWHRWEKRTQPIAISCATLRRTGSRSGERCAVQYRDEFDQLFDDARQFADAAGIQNEMAVMEPFLVSVLLAQEIQIQELEERPEEDVSIQ